MFPACGAWRAFRSFFGRLFPAWGRGRFTGWAWNAGVGAPGEDECAEHRQGDRSQTEQDIVDSPPRVIVGYPEHGRYLMRIPEIARERAARGQGGCKW